MTRFPLRRTLAVGSILGAALSAHAGSVITTNLPTGVDAIVNIDATQDGASGYDGDQSNWYQPYAGTSGFTELTLGPGTYTFDLTDAADSTSAFPKLSDAQRSQLYTGWTYNSPWITNYLVFDSSALTNSSESQLFSGSFSYGSFGSGLAAYTDAKANGYSSQIVVSPGGRLHGTVETSYTLTSTETLIFDVPDQDDADNSGGVSVVVKTVTQPTPEPATFAALGFGLLALRRRKKA